MKAPALKLMILSMIAGGLLGCSPGYGFRSAEERWSASQLNQPVAYKSENPGAPGAKPHDASATHMPTGAAGSGAEAHSSAQEEKH